MEMTAAGAGGSCHQQQGRHLPCTCPPWLQSAITEIEQRMESLSLHPPEQDNSDSFAERAENYYHKRPQLLSLLHDLHKSYLYLAERYSLSILPKHHPIVVLRSASVSSDAESVFSDADSSISFQPPPPTDPNNYDLDRTLTALVLAHVEKDVLAECMSDWDKRQSDSTRKVELQRSLLDLLETERMVLVTENSRLAFRAVTAEEEARAMAAETGYMRKRANELARCVVRMREDNGSCMLWRTIEALQKQVYALQKRNGEWYDVMVRCEREEEVRMEAERLREENARLRLRIRDASEKAVGKRRWWKRVDWGLFGHCGSVGCGGVKGKKSLCFGDHFQCL